MLTFTCWEICSLFSEQVCGFTSIIYICGEVKINAFYIIYCLEVGWVISNVPTRLITLIGIFYAPKWIVSLCMWVFYIKGIEVFADHLTVPHCWWCFRGGRAKINFCSFLCIYAYGKPRPPIFKYFIPTQRWRHRQCNVIH